MASYYGTRDSKGYRLRLDITLGAQSIPNNNTPIDWALYLECTTSYFSTFASTFSAIVDGATVFSTTNQVVSLSGQYSSVLLASGSRTIDHNPDGAKTLSFSGSFRTNSSASYTPSTIPLVVSGSQVLPTIPRTSLLNSFSDFQIETTAGVIAGNLTIYSATFNHTVKLLQNGIERASWAIAAGPTGSYNFALTLSAAQRDAIFGAMPSVDAQSFSLEVATFSGATQIGSAVTKTAVGTIPSNYKPVITTANSNYSFTNKNSKLITYLIKTVSTLTLLLSGGTVSTGATLSEYKIRFGAITRTGVYSGAAISENVGLIATSGTLLAYYSIKDSRGRWSTEISESLVVNDYSPPISTGFDVKRNSVPTSADFDLNFSNSLYSLGNTWTYTPYYWNGSTWVACKAATAIAAASINAVYTHSLPYSESLSYNMKVVLIDQFNSVEYIDTMPTSAFPLSYGTRGIGVGKDTSDTYDLEVGLGGIQSDGPASISGILTKAQRRASYLNAITNADDILEEWVLSGSTAGSTNFPNYPTLSWWYLHTIQYSDDRRMQVAYGYSSNEIWRRYLGTSWSAWVKIYPQSSPLDAYPIGAVYLAVDSTSPATLFGGTWARIGHGRTLFGQYDSDADFNVAEETGGDKTHVHTSAAHVHGGGGLAALINIASTGATYLAKKAFAWTGNPSTRGGSGNYTTVNGDANTTAGIIGGSTDSTTPGNTGSSSNVPPYLVVYMWKRTA